MAGVGGMVTSSWFGVAVNVGEGVSVDVLLSRGPKFTLVGLSTI